MRNATQRLRVEHRAQQQSSREYPGEYRKEIKKSETVIFYPGSLRFYTNRIHELHVQVILTPKSSFLISYSI